MNCLTQFFTLLFLLCCIVSGIAQNPCSADQLDEEFKALDPDYQSRRAALEAQVQQYLANKKDKKGAPAESQAKSGDTYTIPVVVHVIYTEAGAANNISDAQVESAIQRLNDVYSNATGLSVNTGIEFCLASRDPHCNPTNGILHVDGSGVADYVTEGIDNQVTDTDGKGAKMISVFNLSRWNPAEYLNIYIVSEIADNNGGSGVQGYAFYPGASFSYDGMVILYNAFGYDYNNCNCFQLKSYTNTNATAIHEVGHYFNLKHTFEGDGNGTVCPDTTSSAGDHVADTPAHIYSYSCMTGGNNCYPSGHPFYSWDEIIHNYMGYATESCKYEFSQGQADRMIAALETYRYALVHSKGCQDITLAEPPAAACSPQTTTGLTTNYGMGPVNVAIGDLVAGSGSSYEDGGYLDRWCNSAIFEYNTSYSIAINNYGLYDEDVRVYIDYNNDGSLSETELVMDSQNKKFHSGSFTIPNAAKANTPLRLRIISDYFSFGISSSCYTPTYGQAEDYSIYINGLNPVLNASTQAIAGLYALTNKASAAKTFTISGTDLGGNVTVSTASNQFELSSNGTNYTGSLLFSPTNYVLANKTIYVRLKSGLAVGSYAGSITISSNGATPIHITLQGETGQLDAVRGNAVVMGEDIGFVETNLPLPATYTKEAWVKYSGGSQIASFQPGAVGGHSFGVINGRLAAGHGANAASAQDTDTFPAGDWVHVAVTYNSATKELKLYKNGILVSQANNIGAHGGGTLEIGSLDQSNYLIGELDEVRIWNTVRSAQEIRENMHLTLTGLETGLVAYYQFNETAGWTAFEHISGYHGSLYGSTEFAESGINCGREGVSQTIFNIGSIGVKNFNNAFLSIAFTAKNGAEDFTVTYQQFAPNLTTGTTGFIVFDNPVWTVNRSTASSTFTANLSFTFPIAMADPSAGNYALYHRPSGSSGDWVLVDSVASSLTGAVITFEGIQVTGQFMVVQTQESSERGNALSLDGSSGYLSTPLTFNPNQGPFTIECWVKTEGDEQDFHVIFDKTPVNYAQPLLMAVWRNKLFARFGDKWLEGSIGGIFTPHEWHHVALTWNGIKCNIYVDGKTADSQLINSLGNNTEPLFFGTFHQGDHFFNGQLEEIRVWQTARTRQEIAENMHLTAKAKMSNPLAYYQFNETYGPTVGNASSANEASMFGNAALLPSGANVGGTGASQTYTNISNVGVFDFANAKLKMELTSMADTCSFTSNYQAFKPNTTEGAGILATVVYDNPTWTIVQEGNAAFMANLTFTFPNGTFTNMIPPVYQLYHRSVGSDGPWQPLVFGASSVTNSSISFQGVSVDGQFMVVRE